MENETRHATGKKLKMNLIHPACFHSCEYCIRRGTPSCDEELCCTNPYWARPKDEGFAAAPIDLYQADMEKVVLTNGIDLGKTSEEIVNVRQIRF